MKFAKNLLSMLSALALFSMMVLTFADVFSRKFLGNSVTGAVEVTELAMLVMIFCALPLASLAGEHIAFDLLDRFLPAPLLRWQLALSNTLTCLVFAFGAWVVWNKAQRTVNMGDITATLEIPIAPFHLAVVAALALTALSHAALAWRAARSLQPHAAP